MNLSNHDVIRHGANRHPRAIIDLEAIRQNYRYLKQVAGGNRLIAVLKADAYGHGAREVATALEDADAFALSDCAEGLVLKSDPLTIGCPSGTCASDDCCEAPPMPSTDDTGSSSAPRAYAAMAVGAAAVLASKL